MKPQKIVVYQVFTRLFGNTNSTNKPWGTKEENGVGFGGDYSMAWLGASESLGEDTAFSGIYRLFADWTLVGRATGNTGALVVKVENRHRLSTIVPQDLGFETGYAGLTGVPFSNYSGNRDWGLTNRISGSNRRCERCRDCRPGPS